MSDGFKEVKNDVEEFLGIEDWGWVMNLEKKEEPDQSKNKMWGIVAAASAVTIASAFIVHLKCRKEDENYVRVH